MADVMASLHFTFSQDSNGGNNVTLFALPGSSANKTYTDVNIDITFYAYSDKHIYVSGNAEFYRGYNILVATYPVIFGISPTDFNWSYSGGTIVIPSSFKTLATGTVSVVYGTGSTDSNRGTFDWTPSYNLVDIGLLTDYAANLDGDNGYAWLSGTGTYSGVTDESYPDPYKVTIPGFKEFIESATDYYPWAVRNSSNTIWQSCNRDGGYVKRYSGSSWIDVKNVTDDSDSSSAFYYDSGWKICPKIGEE